MKRSTTKRALWLSVLSMFLCLTMFMGTTFAWFTDEVTSGTNTIVAGNLDVELYHNNKNTTTDEKVDGNTKLFQLSDKQLWEPGAVVYENLTVANEGNLALKYKLCVDVGDSEILKALKVAVVYDTGITTQTREELKKIDGYIGLESFMLDGELQPKQTKTYGIVIWWEPAENDNDYNMNNGKTEVLEATIGVVLEATQLQAEADSFGLDYDRGANLIVSGEYVAYEKIESNLTVNKGDEATIKLAGNTVGGAITNYGDTTVTDGTIEVDGRGFNNAGNATVDGVTMNAGSAASYANLTEGVGAVTTYDNTVINAGGGAVGVADGGKAIFNSGSIYVNSKSTSARYHFYAEGEGSTIIINGGSFDFDRTQNQKRAYLCAVDGGTIVVNGGTFATASSRSGYTAGVKTDNGTIIIKGGTFGFDPTTWVAEGYVVTKTNGVWTVAPKATDSASLNDAIADAIANGEKNIGVAAGTYGKLPTGLQAGMTLDCAEGTVFEGNSKLNINGATVIGATFSNPSGTAVDQTINGTFRDCDFTGSNALRWCYAGDNVVFENCTFSGDVYGVHFDGGADDVVFKNCTFSGFNALGGAITKLTLEGCTFVSNGRSNYNGINMWGSTEMIDCTFVFDGTAGYQWVDACGDNKTYTFTGCVVSDGTTERALTAADVGDYGTGNTITVN